MKRILFLLIAVGLMGSASAQMQAMFSYSTFYQASTGKPYIETYLLFDAWTMEFVQQPSGQYKAEAEVTLILRQQDSIVAVKKYDLASPAVDNRDSVGFNILDLQRFPVDNGIYDLDISLRDKGSTAQPSMVSEKIIVAYDRTHPTLSSVQLMASIRPTTQPTMLSRGGYEMEPYVDDFIPEQMTELRYYYEIYNIDREVGSDAFVAMAYIEELETGQRIVSTQHSARKKAAATVPVLGSVDIKDLPSGNYNLVVELLNREGQTMLYRRLPFFRSNPSVKPIGLSDFASTFVGSYTSEEELNLYLDALYPIASESEKRAAKELVKRPGVEAKQAFLYNFWVHRNALNPEQEWQGYKERIDYVQANFSYPMTRGIMTDRGRVYLQYGPPDFVRDEKNFSVLSHTAGALKSSGNISDIGNGQTSNKMEPDHAFYLPYQLWRYNDLPGDDNNRVFLFWDQFRTGYYTLLNSNAKGEVQEYGWERRLSRNELPEGAVGAVGEQFNRGY